MPIRTARTLPAPSAPLSNESQQRAESKENPSCASYPTLCGGLEG
jgi:hypothetical protein